MLLRFIKNPRKSLFFGKRLHCSTSEYFFTTPIFYVNAKPHVGHLYTALLADAVTRLKKLGGGDVKFMTGTDEHGLKIHQAAKQSNASEPEYVEHVSKMYRDLFNAYNVNYTDFLRTTEGRHKKCVAALWKTLFDKGLIYIGEYSGWYCVSDEAFIPLSQLEDLPNGCKVTIEGKRPVEFVKESNYKFRLSSLRDELIQWLDSGSIIQPTKFQHIVRDWIEEGSVMGDISVSRPRSRVPWGIPVPGDESQMIYVWLDALSCYLTSAGYPGSLTHWPPDVQIIGKDILKFHAIYWPAFLIGAGLKPPKQLLCHSHWVINGEKMSKSKGNVIDPLVEAEKFTHDGFRYFLLREGVPHSDGNYTSVKVQRILNSELADTLGNLLNRCTGKIVNINQVFPVFVKEHHEAYCREDAEQLINSVEALPGVVCGFYDQFEFYKGIDAVIATLHLANQFFEKKKPWELRKQPERANELGCIIHVTLETLRVYTERRMCRCMKWMRQLNKFFSNAKLWLGTASEAWVSQEPDKESSQKDQIVYQKDGNPIDVGYYGTAVFPMVCGILLSPIVPHLAKNLLAKLNIEESHQTFKHVFPFSWQQSQHNERLLAPEKLILFSKIKLE